MMRQKRKAAEVANKNIVEQNSKKSKANEVKRSTGENPSQEECEVPLDQPGTAKTASEEVNCHVAQQVNITPADDPHGDLSLEMAEDSIEKSPATSTPLIPHLIEEIDGEITDHDELPGEEEDNGALDKSSSSDKSNASTNSQLLASKRTRSWVWTYFKPNAEKNTNDCQLCSSSYSTAKSLGSTRIMITHLMNVHHIPFGGFPDGTAPVITNCKMAIIPVPYTERNLRRCIINWIIQEDEPFTSVEKPSFHQMLSCSSNNKATIISSHSTVKLDCEKMHAFAEKWIKYQLEKIEGRLSFTVDVASSRYKMFPLVGITAHWTDEKWTLRDLGLSMMPLKGSHTGENLKEAFLSSVETRFGVLEKFQAVTSDSASNNGTFLSGLVNYCREKGIFHAHKIGSRVNCFAHILNLSVQDLLKNLKKDADFTADEESESEYESGESEEENDEPARPPKPPPKNILKKLKKLIKAIRASGQRRELYETICADLGVKHLELIIDCVTRWNSTYEMMERALLMQQVIERFVLINSDPDVQSLVLSSKEWEYISFTADILKEFKDASEAMCNAKYPTLGQALPYFHYLRHFLNQFLKCKTSARPNYPELEKLGKPLALARAVYLARNKFDKYFKLANHSESPHAIATVLDPRFKMEYFEKTGWDNAKLDKIQNKLRMIWVSMYRPANVPSISKNPIAGPHVVDKLWLTCSEQVNLRGGRDFRNAGEEDELTKYLESPIETTKSCPEALEWWNKNKMSYPFLSKMARDFLAVPATSVPVERRFSNLVDIVTPNRATLHVESIKLLHELKEYLRFGGNELFSLILNADY